VALSGPVVDKITVTVRVVSRGVDGRDQPSDRQAVRTVQPAAGKRWAHDLRVARDRAGTTTVEVMRDAGPTAMVFRIRVADFAPPPAAPTTANTVGK
ncbi:MAG TPA: hypothetical protein VF796_29965, partial [Humisphaera sp.]